VSHSNGVIADGSVRSGKTLAVALSFMLWANQCFDGMQFAMCGATARSLRRNVVTPLVPMLLAEGFSVKDNRGENKLTISKGGRRNFFYLFGGADEDCQDAIQGMTLAGVLFDEAVLLAESFVNQAVARCSVAGSKFWFTCNPDGPFHWFKKNWIDRAEQKGLLYLHFTMRDNPSLSDEVRRRYESLYTGVFRRRFVLGEWSAAQGAVYDMFDPKRHIVETLPRTFTRLCAAVDYGTANPTVFLLFGESDGVWYGIREYYYDGRAEGRSKTDVEYADDLEAFLDGTACEVIADPSAASFLAELRRRGIAARKANNAVVDGIRRVGNALESGRLKFCVGMEHTVREFYAYVWDEDAAERGEDRPVKQNDHAMDAVRYFVMGRFFVSERENRSR